MMSCLLAKLGANKLVMSKILSIIGKEKRIVGKKNRRKYKQNRLVPSCICYYS